MQSSSSYVVPDLDYAASALDEWGELAFPFRAPTAEPPFAESLELQTEEELGRLAGWARSMGISSLDAEYVVDDCTGDECEELAA